MVDLISYDKSKFAKIRKKVISLPDENFAKHTNFPKAIVLGMHLVCVKMSY